MKTRNRYYLLRHAQSEANRDGVICSHPSNGLKLCGLTEEGVAQVREALKTHPFTQGETVIYASDFMRARQTAEIAAEIIGTGHVHFTPLLRERFFGDYEGRSQDYYHVVWNHDLGNPSNRDHDVESPLEVRARVLKLIGQCEEAHETKTILLVSHGDTLQILVTAFIGLSPDRHRDIPPIGNCDIRLLSENIYR